MAFLSNLFYVVHSRLLYYCCALMFLGVVPTYIKIRVSHILLKENRASFLTPYATYVVNHKMNQISHLSMQLLFPSFEIVYKYLHMDKSFCQFDTWLIFKPIIREALSNWGYYFQGAASLYRGWSCVPQTLECWKIRASVNYNLRKKKWNREIDLTSFLTPQPLNCWPKWERRNNTLCFVS